MTVIDIVGFHEIGQLTCSCPSISQSYSSLHLVQWMPAFGHANAIGGSTREQSSVPHSCKKGLCSATRQRWCSTFLPKRQMLPYLPICPSHSQAQFWPFAQAADCSHLTYEWVQLTNYRMHPSNPRFLPTDAAELASHWQQQQCNRRSSMAWLEVGSSCWKHWKYWTVSTSHRT